MRSSNGSLISIYCKVEDYIDGYNCSQIFQENNSSQSGYYKFPINGSIASVYCSLVDYINGLHLSNCSVIWRVVNVMVREVG